MGPLRTRRSELRERLAKADSPRVVLLHPSAADQYRDLISQLAELTPKDEPAQLIEPLRNLIEEVRLTPTGGRGTYSLKVTV